MKKTMSQADFVKQTPFRAAVITMPSDEPNQVAAVTQMLYGNTDFEVTVLGFDVKPRLSLQGRDSHIGATMPGFAAREFIKYGGGETQTHCRDVWDCLKNDRSDDLRIKLSYISGPPTAVAKRLNPAFDLLVVPRILRSRKREGVKPTGTDRSLIRAKKLPILFCGNPNRWQHMLVMKVSNDQDYEEIPVIEYLLRFLGERAQREPSQELPAIGLHAEHPANGSLPLASYSVVDAASLTQAQQKTTVLVASTAITCSPFRHRRLKNILYKWNGNVLVFPSG
ncbi:MAG: hypothetical protein JXM79_20235 [Sedimentisphaerales bacterium]|nr:hypothetical protein [Sedimentisphaerales bacterium]